MQFSITHLIVSLFASCGVVNALPAAESSLAITIPGVAQFVDTDPAINVKRQGGSIVTLKFCLNPGIGAGTRDAGCATLFSQKGGCGKFTKLKEAALPT